MRMFQSCQEMYNEVRRDLHEMGTMVHPQTMQDKVVATDDRFKTLELSPYGFTLLEASDQMLWLDGLGKSTAWVKAEFAERLRDSVNPGTAWELRADTWRPFLHDKQFAYTYSQRLNRRPLTAKDSEGGLSRILHELHDRPDTRQAIVPIFNGDEDLPNLGGKARIPCSLYYQFLRRDGALQMIYAMRSSDFSTHFAYDIVLALMLRDYLADLLDIPPGRFTFFTGSLHLYAKDADPGVF